MNTYDLVCTGLLIFSAWKGFKKGLIRELAGLTGIILALWIAWKWMGNAGFFIQGVLPELKQMLPFVAFIAMFSVVITSVMLFTRFATRLLDMTLILGFINRISGSLIATLQVSLFIILITWLADYAGVLTHTLKNESKLYPVTQAASPLLYSVTERYFPDSDSLLRRVREKWGDEAPDE